jgi:adenylylsulfate kinase
MGNNIHIHRHAIGRCERSAINGHQAGVIWFTGLSGSGKSSIAGALEVQLNRAYRAHTYLLDGDNIRSGLNRDLGFSVAERRENIRRVAEVAGLMYDAGLLVLTAFISPLAQERAMARTLIGSDFVEVYVRCSLAACEGRDPKGLYAKARRGALAEFTGISSPYEEPQQPELVLDSERQTLEMCVASVVEYLKFRQWIGDLNG